MKKFLLSLMLIATCFQLSACGVRTVDPGEAGVMKSWGKVDADAKPPGLYMYNPFRSSLIILSTQTQKFDGDSEVYTKDVQQVQVSFTINYALNLDSVVKIYSSVGEDYEKVLIPQVISGNMKNVIGKWDAIELVANRSKATADIEAAISEGLKGYGINVSGFQLTNIKFQPQFEAAVEAKVAAVQQAEQAHNETVKIQEKANQTIISAKADAEAMQIKSEALAKNQGLIAYEAVQKWNGKLPEIVGGNQLMNVQDMFNGKTPQ